MRKIVTFLVDWLLAENVPTGYPNYVGVGILSTLAMLAMCLFIVPIAGAIHDGKSLAGFDTNYYRGEPVYTPYSRYWGGLAMAPFFGALSLLAVACHKGNLDKYASAKESSSR